MNHSQSFLLLLSLLSLLPFLLQSRKACFENVHQNFNGIEFTGVWKNCDWQNIIPFPPFNATPPMLRTSCLEKTAVDGNSCYLRPLSQNGMKNALKIGGYSTVVFIGDSIMNGFYRAFCILMYGEMGARCNADVPFYRYVLYSKDEFQQIWEKIVAHDPSSLVLFNIGAWYNFMPNNTVHKGRHIYAEELFDQYQLLSRLRNKQFKGKVVWVETSPSHFANILNTGDWGGGESSGHCRPAKSGGLWRNEIAMDVLSLMPSGTIDAVLPIAQITLPLWDWHKGGAEGNVHSHDDCRHAIQPGFHVWWVVILQNLLESSPRFNRGEKIVEKK